MDDVSDQEFIDKWIEDSTRLNRSSFNKPFHAGKRLLKCVGGYDNGIFFAYDAVPYGRQVEQHGKHRLLRVLDSEESTWHKPVSLEGFIRDNQKRLRKYRRSTALLHGRQMLHAVNCLRVGQSIHCHFWAWDLTLKRVK